MADGGDHGELGDNSAGTGVPERGSEYVTVAAFEEFARRMEKAILVGFSNPPEVTATSPRRRTPPGEELPTRRAGKEPAWASGEQVCPPRLHQASGQGIRFRDPELSARYGDTRRWSEYDCSSGEDTRRRQEGRSPFCDEILAALVPDNFREPVLSHYSGKDDPVGHLQWFEDVVSIRNMSDALKCRLFSITFKGSARDWFHQLPAGSVYCFSDLRRGLLARFATSKRRKKEATALFKIVQGQHESLGRYIDRFQEEVLEVEEVDGFTLMVALKFGLKQGLFNMELGHRPPKSFEEMVERANVFIQGEERNKEFLARLDGDRPLGKDKGRLLEKGRAPEGRSDRKQERPQRREEEKRERGRELGKAERQERPRRQEDRRPVGGREARSEERRFQYPRDHPQWRRPAQQEERRNYNPREQGGGRRETMTITQRAAKRRRKERQQERRQERQQEAAIPLYCDIHRVEGHGTLACPEFWEARRRMEATTAEREQPQQEAQVGQVAYQEPQRRRNEDRVDQGGRGNVIPGPGGGHVGVINGGAGLGASRKGSLHQIYKKSVASTSQTPPPLNEITFSEEDMLWNENPFHDALLIQAAIEDFTVDRILADNGSSVNVIFKRTFFGLQVEASRVQAADGPLFGFSGEKKEVEGGVELLVTLGGTSIRCRFVIVDAPSGYNSIFGRPLINYFKAVPSSYHQCLKYCRDDVQVRIRGDPKASRECYLNAVSTISWMGDAERLERMMEQEEGLQAAEELEEVEVISPRGEPELLKIGGALPPEGKVEIAACLQENADVFAWSAAEMPGIDADVACHRLNLDPATAPVRQKQRKSATALAGPIREEVGKLLEAGFVSEIQYPGWVSNVVMVKKSGGGWRLCIDFSMLNKACPKDCYPLPQIDALVDSAVGFPVMSFLDAFSGYHQIRMHPPDCRDVSFITSDGCYSYKMMPFGLKNADATYQRMMDQVFKEQKGRNLEVYVDDLLVKSKSATEHVKDLAETFATLRKYKMRLNPTKCVFGAGRGKFLGHLLTPQGVVPNPDKVKAILEMASPRDSKEVQRLTGRLAGLSRFLSKAGEKCSPFFKALRGNQKFEWTPECEEAFIKLKQQLTRAPLLQGPQGGEDLLLYLGVGAEAVSSVLVREEGKKQLPIYCVSRVLRQAETRYPILEKLVFALVVSTRRLRPYFQAHSIKVVSDHPLRSILDGVEHSGRLAKWAVELSEFDISYPPRAVADFLADFSAEVEADMDVSRPVPWKMFVDGASGRHSVGAGVVLVSPQGTRIEQAVEILFPVTNNQAEYEAMVAGLRLAKELAIRDIQAFTDSMVAASQIRGEFEVRDPILQQYLFKVKGLIRGFRSFHVEHVPRERNSEADNLAKYGPRAGGTAIELFRPSIEEGELMEIDQRASWRDPFIAFLATGRLPSDGQDQRKFRYKAAYYLLQDGELFRKTISGPLARCLSELEIPRVLEEIHSGECGSHSGTRTLEQRILRHGYFWPTIRKDAEAYSRKCSQCQLFAPLALQPAQQLRSITAPWPFAIWGMDLIGPFPQASGQRKFVLVMVDYFTKWIEAKALARTTSQIVKNFIWGEIACRFGIPLAIITDNGPQFASLELGDFCKQLGTDLRFASVHHPRSNGQVEAANKLIINLLKKKITNLKGNWAEQLLSVLWALRTTPNSATRETPFKLSHGSEALIPVEFEVHSPRVIAAEDGSEEWRLENEEAQRLSLDYVEELRDLASMRQEETKRRMARHFDKNVRLKNFLAGDLVMKKVDAAGRGAAVGKLRPNWEGPFIVQEALATVGYYLQDQAGEQLPGTWSGDDLKRFYP
ncbi:hypothetical protein KSP39_PZI017133 [Platanthera zijinensis]|uniref:Uncharacterized protein n=1 Tax=Platanthera zijinensis TaxID=2320716 RepID=A0AAP0B5X4_9ASPA